MEVGRRWGSRCAHLADEGAYAHESGALMDGCSQSQPARTATPAGDRTRGVQQTGLCREELLARAVPRTAGLRLINTSRKDDSRRPPVRVAARRAVSLLGPRGLR